MKRSDSSLMWLVWVAASSCGLLAGCTRSDSSDVPGVTQSSGELPQEDVMDAAGTPAPEPTARTFDNATPSAMEAVPPEVSSIDDIKEPSRNNLSAETRDLQTRQREPLDGAVRERDDVLSTGMVDAEKKTPARATTGILASEVPIPEGARVVERSGDVEMITFRSDWGVSKVADFYRNEMGRRGWKEVPNESLVDEEIGVGGITFCKDGTSFRIVIQNGQSASKTRMVILGDGLVWSEAENETLADAHERAPAEQMPSQVSRSTPVYGSTAAGAVQPEKRTIGSRCIIHYGDKTYEFEHFAAYQRQEFAEPVTVLLVSEKSIDIDRLRALLKKDFVSAFDLFEFDIPRYMELRLTGDYVSLSCSIDETSVNLSSSDIRSAARVADGRVRGRIHLPEPHDALDKPFRFEVTVDTELLVAPAASARPAPDGALAVDDSYELPVPVGAREALQSGSRFLRSLNATIEADLTDVLLFYQRELPRRDWREVSDRCDVTANQATFVFQGREGELQLKLRHERQRTIIRIDVRNAKLAEAAGILPTSGKAKLILGNAHEQPATIVIDGKAHSIAAGVGAEDPADAESLEVSPGSHAVTVKIPGEADQSEQAELAADETWGVIVIPTGGFFLDRLY